MRDEDIEMDEKMDIHIYLYEETKERKRDDLLFFFFFFEKDRLTDMLASMFT